MDVDWCNLLLEHDLAAVAILAAVNSPSPAIPVPSIKIIALQRSRAMVEAYRLLIAERNVVVTSAIIRMQLDSLMRVHAVALVDDPMTLWTALEGDDPWSKVKVKGGKALVGRLSSPETGSQVRLG